MELLSSKATFYYKRVFPIFWFGIIALVFVIPVFQGLTTHRFPPLPFFAILVIMPIFGYVIFRKLIFDLVDEVVDLGDGLLVKNGDRQDRIALTDIINVNYTPMMSPPRVTLTLRTPSLFGREVTFCAPMRLLPMSKSARILKLIERVDAARRAG